MEDMEEMELVIQGLRVVSDKCLEASFFNTIENSQFPSQGNEEMVELLTIAAGVSAEYEELLETAPHQILAIVKTVFPEFIKNLQETLSKTEELLKTA